MVATPEKFFVGETVTRYCGEDHWDVTVVDVNGDKVTILDGHRTINYKPRNDGKHVKVGSPAHEVMPDMIYHRKAKAKSAPAVKKSFFKKLKNLF